MPERFADGSMTGDRAASAFVRACDSYRHVSILAKRVSEELDEVTSPGVIPQFSDEDSLVTTIGEVLEQANKTAT